MANVRVVCNDCAGKYDDIDGVTAAWSPEFAPGDLNLLVCPPYPPPNPLDGMRIYPCSDCGTMCAVSPTSAWLFTT